MSSKFIICEIDKFTRLAGSSDSFIVQVKSRKSKSWSDKFYYYSIGDMIRGVVRYISSQNPKLAKSDGIEALMLLLNKIENKTKSFCDRVQQIYDSDPVERASIPDDEQELA